MKNDKHELKNIKSWRGIWTALVTPLKKSPADAQLVVDKDSLASLIESQINAGVRGLVIAGSTGEGSLLSEHNYLELLRATMEVNAGKVPLIAGVGIGGTESCVKKAKLAKDVGFDGLLASPPAYVKAPQRGLIEHYLRLAQEELPICVYEIPGRSAYSLKLESLEALAKSSDPAARFIIATKDASNDIERARKTHQLLGDRIALLSGEDGSFDAFVAAGGIGLISVASHVMCKKLTLVLDAGAELNDKDKALIDALFSDANPIPVKTLLAEIGQLPKNSIEFSPPLCPMQAEDIKAMLSAYNNWMAAQ